LMGEELELLVSDYDSVQAERFLRVVHPLPASARPL
jgi:hypothetical protein